MSIRALYLLIIFLAFAFQGSKSVGTRWVIANGCSLKVVGSTNINTFTCAIAKYSTPDTIWVNRSSSSAQLNGKIALDIKNFDCGHAIMTADLRKTLKAKEFPTIIIKFISIGKYPSNGTREGITKGSVMIELAGVSKPFEVDYKIVSAENNNIHLVGSRKVNFSDFNITPPRKLGGMIRTNNELSVEFNLRLKVIG
jgi:hypothetical protein